MRKKSIEIPPKRNVVVGRTDNKAFYHRNGKSKQKRFHTIDEAQDFIESLLMYDSDGIDKGEYYIDVIEEKSNS